MGQAEPADMSDLHWTQMWWAEWCPMRMGREAAGDLHMTTVAGSIFMWPVNVSVSSPCPIALSLFHGGDCG